MARVKFERSICKLIQEKNISHGPIRKERPQLFDGKNYIYTCEIPKEEDLTFLFLSTIGMIKIY